MKKIAKRSVLLSLFFLVGMIVFEQSGNAQIIDNQKEMMTKRCREKVGQFNDYLSMMADKQYDSVQRLAYKAIALQLFIGDGNPYMEYDSDGSQVRNEGVLMQTTSINRRNSRPISSLMRVYLQKVIGLRYSQVSITSTKVADMKVSDLQKIAENEYVCTVYYVQYFRGSKGDKIDYGDKTAKRIICYIETEDTEDGIEYIVRLGDTEATCTERL